MALELADWPVPSDCWPFQMHCPPWEQKEFSNSALSCLMVLVLILPVTPSLIVYLPPLQLLVPAVALVLVAAGCLQPENRALPALLHSNLIYLRHFEGQIACQT